MSMMTRVLGLVMMGAVTGGCASAILENPTTKQRVNCTADATRLALSVPPGESTGKDVPRYDPGTPALNRFDFERQCVDGLKREGFVCVSGC